MKVNGTPYLLSSKIGATTDATGVGARTQELYDKGRSAEFYEERYEQGYMEEWPAERKRRLFQVLSELSLPEQGDALDFGCGNGVLTEIVRQALPKWNVVGTDLSDTAVRNARARFPRCEFVTADALDRKFDFLFTHHVLEHVFDLPAALAEMDRYLKPRAAMLHIAPCGNAGSFEHGVCLLRRDGIDEKLEGRFFYEDEGHVRRLTTDRLAQLCADRGFELARELYANQRAGAIDWITNTTPAFVRRFTDAARAVDADAARRLRRVRRKLALIAAARLPARVLREFRGRPIQIAALLATLPLLPVSIAVDRYWRARSEREWERCRTDRAGSEMMLYFTRTP